MAEPMKAAITANARKRLAFNVREISLTSGLETLGYVIGALSSLNSNPDFKALSRVWALKCEGKSGKSCRPPRRPVKRLLPLF
jgi:hypothetical protein